MISVVTCIVYPLASTPIDELPGQAVKPCQIFNIWCDHFVATNQVYFSLHVVIRNYLVKKTKLYIRKLGVKMGLLILF